VIGKALGVAAALAFLTLGVVQLVVMRRAAAPLTSAREALLTLQNQELEALVASAEAGKLLDFDGVLVVVDEALVRDLLRAATPLEAKIGGGFHVKIETADAAFSGGVALVTLTGLASLEGGPDSSRVTVFSAIDVVALNPATGTLHCSVSILGVEAEDPLAFGQKIPMGKLTEELAHGGLSLLLGSIEIPVSVEDKVSIPEVSGKRLHIAAETLPLTVAVRQAKAFGRRLWVIVDAAFKAPASMSALPPGAAK
jgi:hypothetical protein